MNHLTTQHDEAPRLRIGLDFDDTYTAAPELWDLFIQLAKAKGHEVRFVTYRPAFGWNSDIDAAAAKNGIAAVFTAGAQKGPHCAAIGWPVSIWIDDMPEAIPSLDAMKAMTIGIEVNGA